MYTFRVGDRVVANEGALSVILRQDLSGRVGTVASVVEIDTYIVRWDGLNYGNSVRGEDLSPVPVVTSQFKVGDTVRTVTETYGDAYVPVGSVGVVVEVLGNTSYSVRFDDAPSPTAGADFTGWVVYAKQLEAYVEPEHLVISESIFDATFTVGGTRFNFSDDPETLDHISEQYAAAAEYIRTSKTVEAEVKAEMTEPQEYGARVELDDPRTGADPSSRVIATRVGFDSHYPWLILWEHSVSGDYDYRWNAYIWEAIAKRNPVLLDPASSSSSSEQ